MKTSPLTGPVTGHWLMTSLRAWLEGELEVELLPGRGTVHTEMSSRSSILPEAWLTDN